MSENNLSQIKKDFRSNLTTDMLKMQPAEINSLIEGQVSAFIDKHTNSIYKGYVTEKDFKEQEEKIKDLEKSIEEKDASMKTFEEVVQKNKIGLLVGKVAKKTENIVAEKYGKEIKEDGSNIEEIVKKAHEELPFTKTSNIDDFGKSTTVEEKNEDSDEDKKSLNKITEAFSIDSEEELLKVMQKDKGE